MYSTVNVYRLKHIFCFIFVQYLQETAAHAWDMLKEITLWKLRIVERYRIWENITGELLPFANEIEDKKTIFQRDNASIHTAVAIKKMFQDFVIELLPWPALSADPNTTENLRNCKGIAAEF